jgi:hypothetical protein
VKKKRFVLFLLIKEKDAEAEGFMFLRKKNVFLLNLKNFAKEEGFEKVFILKFFLFFR